MFVTFPTDLSFISLNCEFPTCDPDLLKASRKRRCSQIFFLLLVAYMPLNNYTCFAAQVIVVVALCPETAGSSHMYQVEDG